MGLLLAIAVFLLLATALFAVSVASITQQGPALVVPARSANASWWPI